MHAFFALTFRGLEAVSAREIAALPGVAVREVAYRRVAGTCAESPLPLLGLRTVDDVFLEAAVWSGIGRQRSALGTLRALSSRLDLRPAAATCAGIRAVGSPPAFSVTASFVGKRNYNTAEIKQAAAEGIRQNHPWRYVEDDAEADLNVRLFIEHEQAWVGVRLSRRPLHDRAYLQGRSGGSLKPPAAAAMILLAGVAARDVVLDPCCGAGTILIEAAHLDARPLGGDIDLPTVRTAQANAARAGLRVPPAQWDARSLPVAGESVACVVSNLPWGLQAAAAPTPEAFAAAACRELRRVLAPGGRIVLLTNAPEQIAFPDLQCSQQIEISLFGQRPTILVFTSP